MIADCGKAADLLDEKSTTDEADGYKEWVLTIGRKVASAAKEKDSGGQKISQKEEALLTQVVEALRVDTQTYSSVFAGRISASTPCLKLSLNCS